MVELHGWINLRYSDYHSEDQLQRDFVYRFKSYVQNRYDWVLVENLGHFSHRNGLDCFSLHAHHNHPDEPLYALGIFAWAARESTGSYGLLYVHDDEDIVHAIDFQVYALKRGQLTKASVDSFLSPYHEKVEREYDEENPPLD